MTQDLVEWTVNYIKHRDLVLKKLKDLRVEKDSITAEYKTKTEVYFIMPHLAKEVTTRKEIIICYNTRKNFEMLLDRWDELAKNNSKIIFVNPKSTLDTKWIIRPAIHNRICDEKSLKLGLKAMYETVDEV